jgi:hypothetical protein
VGVGQCRHTRVIKETARVKPAPTPPERNLIPLMSAPRSGQEGRFTVLSYNLLADLFASVRHII